MKVNKTGNMGRYGKGKWHNHYNLKKFNVPFLKMCQLPAIADPFPLIRDSRTSVSPLTGSLQVHWVVS